MNAHRRHLGVLATALALGVGTAGAAHAHLYAASGQPINESQEVPASGSTATGTLNVMINTNTNQLMYHITFSGLSSAETAAHIHGPAAPGFNAGVKVGLPAGSPKTGTWDYAQSDEADILAGRMYVNIHSVNFPAGEIRGQIVPGKTTMFEGSALPIDASQEVPTNGSTASGTMNVMVNPGTNQLMYHITFSGLSSAETAAHIHGPAAPGFNAGVKVGVPAGSPKNGTWDFPQSDEADILAGRMYVNIHSANFPGGEIRGQIVLGPDLPGASPIGLAALALALLGTGSWIVLRRRRRSSEI